MRNGKIKNTASKITELYIKWGQKSFLFTLVCIVWLAWRISTKPTRLNYPCSQFALWQIIIYFSSISTPVIGICHRCITYIRQRNFQKIGCIALLVLVLAGTFTLYYEHIDNQLRIAGSGTIPASSSSIISPGSTSKPEQVNPYLDFPDDISTDHAVVSFSHDLLIDYGGIPPYDAGSNPAYDFVWETVVRLQLGSSLNPLDDLIDTGDTVLIKPNWVDDGEAVFTRPEVVRPLIDMAIAAGATEIYVGDGGVGVPAVNNVMDVGGYTAMIDALSPLHPGITIETVNLCSHSDGWRWISLSENSSFAGSGISHADLGTGSESLYNHQYYTTPDPQGVNPGGNTLGWYAVNDKLLEADVIINASKMKTHQIMMATMSIKNHVGSTISSTYNENSMTLARIAHHPYPTPTEYNFFYNNIFWRAILDMNKIILYTDEEGVFHQTQQRKILNVVDGIQAMERSQHDEYGGGGLPYYRHVILAGVDPVAVDAVGCRIIGYDYNVIPSIANADSDTVHPIGTNEPENIVVIGDEVGAGINHVFEFNEDWADDAVAINLGLTDFTPPVINIVNRVGTTVTADISGCLTAYIVYQANGQEYLEEMTKDGDIYTGSITGTTSEFKIIAQDEYFNTSHSALQSTEDTTPPYTSGHVPSSGATGVPVDTDIVVHVIDDGDGVDIATITMIVEGDNVTPVITGTPADYTLTYDPPVDFGELQVVDVTVDAADLATPANAMPQDSYSFTTAQDTYTLTVNTVGSGDVTLNPPGGSYLSGTVVELTANATSGWTFYGWSGDLGGSDNPETITMDGNKTVTATFTQNTYTLTVYTVGSGNITLNPPGGSYLYGTVVELTANATPGWTFSSWSSDLGGSDNHETITMDGNKTVTATFTQDMYTLTMDFVGSGNVIPAVGSHVYDAGSTVNITATPANGWNFTGWTGDVGTLADVNAASTTITMDGDYNVTANFVEIQHGGGGSGGGGDGGSGDTTSLSEYNTGTGKFVIDATASSADGLVKVIIPKDTVGKDRNGGRLRFLTIKKQDAPAGAPDSCEFICLTYNITPTGATLDPFGYLVFKYKDADLPEGVAEKNLCLVTWQDGAWVVLEGCIVDPDENTITAPVSHFSVFTAMSQMKPARFEVSGMTVTPAEVQPDGKVTISVTVTNKGDMTGDYTVVLKIRGAAVQEKALTLGGGESRSVSFTVTQDKAGEYTVNIVGQMGSFTVKEPEGEVVEVTPPEPTEPAPPPTTKPVEKPVVTPQPKPKPKPTAEIPYEPVTDEGTAWWLIVIYVVAGVIIVSLGTLYFIRRRSQAG